MSQVVVCQDSFSSKRKASLGQEENITTDDALGKWQRSDATKTLMIERVIAVLFAPIVFLWVFLLSFMGVAFAVSLSLFKLLSKVMTGLKVFFTKSVLRKKG